MPWAPHRTNQHLMSFPVTNELLVSRIPLELPPQPAGNLLDQAKIRSLVSRLDGGDRLAPCLHATDKVGMVAGRISEVCLVWIDTDI